MATLPAVQRVAAVFRYELPRRFTGRSAWVLYVLAMAPVGLMGLWAIFAPGIEQADPGNLVTAFAGLYLTFILRIVVFFGCAAVFTSLFRSDMSGRTMHYYLLTPIRRRHLVLGKFFAGLAATVSVLVPMTALSFIFFHQPIVSTHGMQAVSTGLVSDGVAYLFVTAMACVGYGALFTAVGLSFRNPIVPAVVVLVWEAGNFILPAWLQRLSIVHYLESLSPVPIPDSPFAVPAETTAAIVAVPGLLIVAAALLAAASVRLHRMELPYSAAAEG